MTSELCTGTHDTGYQRTHRMPIFMKSWENLPKSPSFTQNHPTEKNVSKMDWQQHDILHWWQIDWKIIGGLESLFIAHPQVVIGDTLVNVSFPNGASQSSNWEAAMSSLPFVRQLTWFQRPYPSQPLSRRIQTFQKPVSKTNLKFAVVLGTTSASHKKTVQQHVRSDHNHAIGLQSCEPCHAWEKCSSRWRALPRYPCTM